MKYFKSKKIICRNHIIKYLIVLVIVYLTIKISISFLIHINFLKSTFSLNKPNDYLNLVKEKTINNPEIILNMPSNTNKTSNESYTLLSSFQYVENPINLKKIYIYNTHQKEAYSDLNTTVLDASFMFQREASKYNLDVSVEEGDITNFLITNNMDYNYSYVGSRYFILDNIINNNYDLIIDLHRDAIDHDSSTISINDKLCARILFVVGREHDNYQANLNLANNLNNLINSYYPNLSRGVMLKSGPGVNGLYNQDISDKMILLELGGNFNSTDEINNTIILITPIIGEYLNEE